MPGQQLQVTAFVLGRAPSGSDAFEQVTVFSPDQGVLPCLRRHARKAASVAAIPLDLFDEAELWLESSNQGRTWFIKEHRHLTRHPGIGGSYAALRAGAALAALLTRNPVPDDSREAVAALLRQSLAALGAGGRPDIVWFKALFCLLRDEGHPVKQQWWTQLPAAERDDAAKLLNEPVSGQTLAPDAVSRLTQRLEAWVHAETDIKLG